MEKVAAPQPRLAATATHRLIDLRKGGLRPYARPSVSQHQKRTNKTLKIRHLQATASRELFATAYIPPAAEGRRSMIPE
ncbi:hypothetical protein CGCSCA5_v013752 [Colletotrichum siamense]|nr:hypothetical protein CGCSCA5_v013752 [Colletotrichum siamense]KAF4868262.1 hypothetical protein CGCSCA1_v012610 [Colletotrichum siamense]